MFLTLRIALVIALVMLQLIAPLVHAHASEKTLTQGLHIPGLEVYGTVQDEVLAGTTGYSADAEGMVVSVNAGINQSGINLFDFPASSDNSYFLAQQSVLFKTSIFSLASHFSPLVPLIICRLFASFNSPRAPPAL